MVSYGYPIVVCGAIVLVALIIYSFRVKQEADPLKAALNTLRLSSISMAAMLLTLYLTCSYAMAHRSFGNASSVEAIQSQQDLLQVLQDNNKALAATLFIVQCAIFLLSGWFITLYRILKNMAAVAAEGRIKKQNETAKIEDV